MKEIVKLLRDKNMTIATMESCTGTGGAVANEITNAEGENDVLLFGAVTNSNTLKEKIGINLNILDFYTDSSIEVAKEMAKKISQFANSDIGVAITGRISKEDIRNLNGENNRIHVSVYQKSTDESMDFSVKLIANLTRESNKKIIIKKVCEKLKKIIQ